MDRAAASAPQRFAGTAGDRRITRGQPSPQKRRGWKEEESETKMGRMEKHK